MATNWSDTNRYRVVIDLVLPLDLDSLTLEAASAPVLTFIPPREKEVSPPEEVVPVSSCFAIVPRT